VTGTRLLVAAVAFLALAAPAQPRAQPAAQPGAALAPRHVLDAIAAALGGDDLAAAKAAIDPAIAAFPEDPVVRNLAGVIDARRGESRAAQDHFEAAIRLQPRAPAAYINLGRLLQERAGADPEARPAALAVYARLLAIDPQQPEALFQTAVLQVLDGRFEAARQGIDRLPEAARGRPPVLAVRAVALAGSGDADGARSTVAALSAHPQLAREDIDAVLPALARLPEHGTEQALLELLDRRGWAAPATLRRLAAIESAAGRYVPARAWLEKAAARGVPDAALLIELARAAFKAGDAKGALGYLAHARDLEPTNVAVHFLFGIVCVELNLGAEAYESLAKAVALAPDDPDINYAMGAVSLHRHDPSEALPYFEACVRLRPGDPRGRFALGAAKYHSQRLEEARTDLAAVANDPRTAAGAHYYLARIARQRQDLETARREIDAALRANPSHADGWAERGLIETRQGDYAGAEAALQKALALDPDNYDATLHLAALYGRTRDPRKAAQEARLQTLVARREIRAQEFLRLVQAVP
jgi:tetratricopeptide (TPR) repeat protein